MSQQHTKPGSQAKSSSQLAPTGLLSTMLISLILALIFVFQSYYHRETGSLSAVTALAIGALGLAIAFVWRRVESEAHRHLVYRLYLVCCWPALLILSGLVLFPEPMTSKLEIIAVNLPLFAAALTLVIWVLNHKKDNSVLIPASLGLALFLGLLTNTLLDFGGHFARMGARDGMTIRADNLAVDEVSSDKTIYAASAEADDIDPGQDSLAMHDEDDIESYDDDEDEMLDDEEVEEMVEERVAVAPSKSASSVASHSSDNERSAASVQKHPVKADVTAPQSQPTRSIEQRAGRRTARASQPHWSYDDEDNGPRSWHRLDASFRLCQSGKEQSPINIPSQWELQKDILPFYNPSQFGVIDNGHSIEVRPRGDQHIFIQGKRYNLVNVHFHSPSEHYLAGAFFPMEMHLVHRSEGGQLAVIGVLIDIGAHHPEVAKIQEFMPESVGNLVQPREMTLDWQELFPEYLEAYRYYGSLTTPPCSENVLWSVLRTPLKISNQQLEIFRARYKRNNRPLQPLNYR